MPTGPRTVCSMACKRSEGLGLWLLLFLAIQGYYPGILGNPWQAVFLP